MWQIQNIKIQNILSFEDVSIEFKQNELTLIQGINNTDSGAKSNGSGKSSILECIKLALTTNTIKNIKKVDIIRSGESEGYLKMVLQNNATNESLIIEKFFHVKKSNKCILFLDGNKLDHLVDLNISESDKFILSKLGITSEELDNYFLISKEKYVSFFNTSDRVKKELLNQFSKTDKLDKINDLLKEDYSKLESATSSCDKQISIYNGQIEVFKNQLLTLENDKIEIKRDIDIIMSNMYLNDQKIIEESKKLNNFVYNDINTSLLQEEITKISLEDKEIKNSKTLILKKNQLEQQEKLKELKETIREIEKIQNDAEMQLLSKTTCPKCSYEFSLKNIESSIEDIKEALNGSLDLKKELLEDISNLNKEIELIDKNIREINNDSSNLEKINSLKSKINELEIIKRNQENDLRNINNSIKFLNDTKSSYIRQLESLEKNYLVDKDLELNNEIMLLSSKIQDEIKEKDRITLMINELSNIEFTINSFKTSIANQSLEYIQQKSNEFMEKIKCSYKIIINGYKLLSTGKIKDEISIAITRDGVTEESFGRFSSGEKAKADISCILALNEIINYNVSPNGLDFLIVDEIAESIDEEGMINLIESLKTLNKTICLITHVSPDTLYDVNKIVVKKQNGISKIKNY